MWNRRHRWLRRMATTLAFAALTVPTAQARIATNEGVPPRPGAGNATISPQPAGDSFVPRRDPGAVLEKPVLFAPSTGNQFDRGDAAIGAGSALGLILAALGAMGATRHLRRKSLAGT